MKYFIKNLFLFLYITLFVVFLGCSSRDANTVVIKRENFRQILDGKQVDLFILKNKNGCEARITNYGAKLVSLTMPDRDGELADVVLGYETLEGYINGSPSMGATQGRFANRIAGAQFVLNGITYHLTANNGRNSIHGGDKGFRKVVWDATPISTPDGEALELTYLSKDGEEGYPGNLQVKVVYTLTNENELKIDYTATTDKPTVLNLTHHSFFNLAGAGEGDILDHIIQINGNYFLPTDSEMIPTGEIRNVKGTPMDFTTPRRIGERINADDEQLKFAGGYDHCWVLGDPGKLKLAATVFEPKSGRVMEVYTTEPGLQFYTGNSLKNEKGKEGKIYQSRYGFCLEAQHYPDSPNKPHFPSTVLNPGEVYRQTTIYKFKTK